MSADILRRAAAKLRERTTALPEPWRVNPWRAVQSDTESMDGLAACADPHEYDEEFAGENCCVTSGADGLGHETVAAYAELMHPPVALALADWLDAVAHEFEIEFIPWTGLDRPMAVARAVLREEE